MNGILNRNIIDVIALFMLPTTLWFMWPLSLIMKALGAYFSHFLIIFFFIALFTFMILWNVDRICDYSKAGLLSPVDGMVHSVSLDTIDGIDYHKIVIKQKIWNVRAIFAPISGIVIDHVNVYRSTVEVPSFLSKFLGQKISLQRGLKISFVNDKGAIECFILAKYRLGVPFITSKNQKVIDDEMANVNDYSSDQKVDIGQIIGSSNFSIFGATFEIYCPVIKGKTVVYQNQTVIAGETTLVTLNKISKSEAIK